MTDYGSLASTLAASIFGPSARVSVRAMPLRSFADRRWIAKVTIDGDTLAEEWGATSDQAARSLVNRLLDRVRTTHAVASELLEQARAAWV